MTVRKSCRRFAMGCLAVGVAATLSPLSAAGAPPKAPRAGAAAPTKAAAEGASPWAGAADRLKSPDPETVRAALVELKEAGKRAAPHAPAVAELLRTGTTPNLSALALAVLGAAGTAAHAAVVAPYAQHRLTELRSKAVIALGTLGGDKAVPVLRRALGDVDASVRGHAASALGALRARDALTDLYAALDRNVLEAATAIGEVCVADECAAFAAKTGRIGLDVMISGFDAILFRPSTEVPDDHKIKVVERVRDLRTLEANKYLRDLQSRLTGGSPRVKQAVDDAVLATAGASS